MTLNINNSIKFDYIIYTDGACIGNPGPGGWAAIIFYGKDKNIISGFEKQTTNNQKKDKYQISNNKDSLFSCICVI